MKENNYCTVKEKLSREGNKYYQIIKAKKCKNQVEEYDKIFFEVGYCLVRDKDPLLREFINSKIEKNSKIIANVKKSGKSEKKLRKLIAANIKLKELLREYEKQ